MATAPLDYAALLGQARARAIIQTERQKPGTTTNARGCWISTTQPTAEGYCRVSAKTLPNDAWRTLYLHRIAYVAHHGVSTPPGQQASHLCDNPACFNPIHIHSEPGVENRTRSFCAGVLVCPHHNFQVADLCKHNPKCIKPPIPANLFRCCLIHQAPQQPPSSSSSDQEAATQALASELDNEDFSDQPSNLVSDEVEDTGEDPRSGELAPSSRGVSVAPSTYPSSPPIRTGMRRPRDPDDDDLAADQPPPTRLRSASPSGSAAPDQPATSDEPQVAPSTSDEPAVAPSSEESQVAPSTSDDPLPVAPSSSRPATSGGASDYAAQQSTESSGE